MTPSGAQNPLLFSEIIMSLQLVVPSGSDKGKPFTLNVGRDLMLGRSTNAQEVLSDPRVARNHCQDSFAGRRWAGSGML
jgi:hypothetical protein